MATGPRGKRAAAIIVIALRRRRLDCHELRDILYGRGFGYYDLARGVRIIRDYYGEDSLIMVRDEDDRTRRLYVLNPERIEARVYVNEQARRALTETQHLVHHLDQQLRKNGENRPTRNALRYMRNAEEELAEVVASTR